MVPGGLGRILQEGLVVAEVRGQPVLARTRSKFLTRLCSNSLPIANVYLGRFCVLIDREENGLGHVEFGVVGAGAWVIFL